MKKNTSISSAPGQHKKIIRIILILIALVIVILFALIFGIWHNELASLSSIQKVNEADSAAREGNVYWMEISGDYYFGEFLKSGGASSDEELIDFVTESITKGIIPMNISESEIDVGCSSFTAVTENGDFLFARNYDFEMTNTCIVYTDPGEGRHASVSTIDLQFLGIDTNADADSFLDRITLLAAPYVPLDGVNDAGVACSIHMSYQGEGEDSVSTDQQTDAPDLTSTTMLRLILDYADSAEEAVELIAAYDLHDSASSSFHYMVADSTGKSAILEWINTKATDETDTDGSARTLQVTWSDADSFQVMTNFIVVDGYYEGQAQDEIKGLDRYAYITEVLSKTEGILKDEQAAMDILEAVGRRTFKPQGEIITVHSVVYNLSQCTATWVGNENYGDESYTYYLCANG